MSILLFSLSASRRSVISLFATIAVFLPSLASTVQAQSSFATASPQSAPVNVQPVRSLPPVSSPFGWRSDPINGQQRFHAGVDFPAQTGIPVVAARAGYVVFSGEFGGYGQAVVVDHGRSLFTLYGHNSERLVGVGQFVQMGQPIARVGATGRVTGPHLHFETHYNHQYLDPMTCIGSMVSIPLDLSGRSILASQPVPISSATPPASAMLANAPSPVTVKPVAIRPIANKSASHPRRGLGRFFHWLDRDDNDPHQTQAQAKAPIRMNSPVAQPAPQVAQNTSIPGLGRSAAASMSDFSATKKPEAPLMFAAAPLSNVANTAGLNTAQPTQASTTDQYANINRLQAPAQGMPSSIQPSTNFSSTPSAPVVSSNSPVTSLVPVPQSRPYRNTTRSMPLSWDNHGPSALIRWEDSNPQPPVPGHPRVRMLTGNQGETVEF